MIFLQFILVPPSDERPDDLVGADYVARRFGCSVSSVYAGKCGTHGITPVSRDPWRATRAQVEAAHAAFVAPAMPVKAEPRKRISLVRRRKTA